MIQVSPPTQDVGRIVGRQRVEEGERLRPSSRAVVVPCEAGTLLHHTLTSETLLLDDGEASSWTDACGPLASELAARRFLVPVASDELTLDDQVSHVLALMQPQKSGYCSFTVLTTTDCNARCFYCYELGRPRIAMSDQVALDSARFIGRTHGDGEVSLTWFGGEPLHNARAIELMTGELSRLDVPYRSSMVSNCLLFDEELVGRAKNDWNLRSVQVTIDGTGEVYRRTKAYVGIDADTDPLARVLQNVRLLLDAGIRVQVRMNLHKGNEADLMELASELSADFYGCKGFVAYAALIRDNLARPLGYDGVDDAIASFERLVQKLSEEGLFRFGGVGGKRRQNHCMADSGSGFTILPDGRLGLCEHYSDSETVGNVYEGVTDDERMALWRERVAPTPACAACPHHPTCTNLRQCPYSVSGCTDLDRRLKDVTLAGRVRATYKSWAASDTDASR